jgi:hypothetical protein
MTARRSLSPIGKITRGGFSGLLLLTPGTSGVSAESDRPAGEGVARRRIPLADGWLVKQLDSDKPEIATLVRQSQAPDNTWLPARMPAQVHDVLLAHGRIADPHVGRNAAACAWVGTRIGPTSAGSPPPRERARRPSRPA